MKPRNIIAGILGALLALPLAAHAASFSIRAVAPAVRVGDEFEIDLSFDASDTSVNAVAGALAVPPAVSLEDIRTAGSFVNFWVEAPHASGSAIVFSGITPGGYAGSNGTVFSAIFKARSAGAAVFSLGGAEALLNDGAGTPASVAVSNLSLPIGSASGTPASVSAVIDRQPPEAFVPKVSRDPNLFGGEWFLAFSAEDKGAGIAGYRVRESPSAWLPIGAWATATSPYVLADQSRESYIFVMAVDRAGNERTEVIPPAFPAPLYRQPDAWFIAVVLLIAFAVIRFIIWKRKS